MAALRRRLRWPWAWRKVLAGHTVSPVRLGGWRCDDQMDLVHLPMPTHPEPYPITTVLVPGLYAALKVLRPRLDQTYPEQEGTLHRDEAGQPHTLHLLGRDWPVTLVETSAALEVELDLPGPVFLQAVDEALETLAGPRVL
ncbi:hypothetical protein [Deinococcus multiflagellatus]|uniref:Uncharacterized protein n=1 Tax=Deinococcus multiflagellatus TaxID=1656887 RepID=A0ABW1ZTH7_9DEIO|nr:hypothetical protein [Deinococcus multiflagellatus]MBZ9715951.1 hypothetical protein [Deinococcus multiflagellatus]